MDNYDGVVLAVVHDEFKEYNSQLNKVVYDIEGFLDKKVVDAGL